MHYTFNCYWRLLPLFSTEKRLNLAQCCHVVVSLLTRGELVWWQGRSVGGTQSSPGARRHSPYCVWQRAQSGVVFMIFRACQS